jgi:hypothetical protein
VASTSASGVKAFTPTKAQTLALARTQQARIAAAL